MHSKNLGRHIILLVLVLVGCGKAGEEAPVNVDRANSSQMISFIKTQDASPLIIDTKLFDTKEAKYFASTGKNPYIGKQEAINRGKKLFQLYSCTQCHGGNAQGQTGPGLQGPNFKYAKNVTNKGMFETIWNGTNGGMGAKGKGLMDPTDPNNGLSPDEILKIIAWLRSHGAITGNE